MDIKNRLKPILPHIVAIVLFIIASFIYYYPVLEGKVLKANDSMVSLISSKEILDYRAETGEEALWTNSMFSGMPAYLISTIHPGNLIKKIDTVLRVFKMPVSVLFLALAGFYLVLLMFRINPWLALAGASAYGFSSFFFLILAAGHNTQAIALAYMAPMIGGIYYAYRYDAIKGALFSGFILSLQLLSNHPQITYYGLICLLIFGISELSSSIRKKTLPSFLRTTGILIIPFVLAFGVNFASLFTVYEYGKYSIRSKSDLQTESTNTSAGLDRDYITAWSYGIGETMNLMIPNFRGGSSKPFERDSETVRALIQNGAGDAVNSMQKYWGPQPGTEGPHYLGAVVVFLFFLGLFLVKGPEKWWLLAATILSVVLAWGRNFMFFTDLFIDYFPGYNKFRAVTMTLVIAQFCVPLLGFMALRDLFSGSLTRKEIFKGLKLATAITGGAAFVFLLIPSLAGSFLNPYETGFPDWLKTTLINDRKELLQADSFRTLVFILLAAAALTGYMYDRLRKEYVFAIIGLLILADLWGAGKRYLDAERFERPSVIQRTFTPTVADQEILKDDSYHRVLNMTVSFDSDNSPTSYFHKSIGGYHGAKMKRYKELIDTAISYNIDLLSAAFNNAGTLEAVQSAFSATGALNMLNAKYIIYNPDAPPIENKFILGNAWFANTPLIVENANEELSAVNRIDPSREALIDRTFSNLIRKENYETTPGDTIYLTGYKPNELNYKYSADSEKLVIFSEIYYPKGWKAYIDGQETEHFRANYVLRAMIVPGGAHDIRFVFEPASYYTGNKVSLASSILLFLLLGGYILVKIRKRH